MPLPLSLPEFLAAPGPILDVRSPREFLQGHIPNAIHFPLFTDEERAQVGTCYKQVGRDAAVELGFELAGPKFVTFVRQAKALVRSEYPSEVKDTVSPADSPKDNSPVRVHCWRGGLRSDVVAWVLATAGLQVVVLEGGYKTFRRWCLAQLQEARSILILGGMTGTGKTATLHALATCGEQTIDLEGLANHRGSSYGGLGMSPQPSTEQFENQLAVQWAALDPHRPVWLEAESRGIGCCRIPAGVFEQMEKAPAIEIWRSRAERLDILMEVYGSADPAALVEATERIRKRLGGQRTQAAVELLQKGQLRDAFDILLHYYDKTYAYDLKRRESSIGTVDVTGLAANESAKALVDAASFATP
jgi:tRNA 2-selenouridine synthase